MAGVVFGSYNSVFAGLRVLFSFSSFPHPGGWDRTRSSTRGVLSTKQRLQLKEVCAKRKHMPQKSLGSLNPRTLASWHNWFRWGFRCKGPLVSSGYVPDNLAGLNPGRNPSKQVHATTSHDHTLTRPGGRLTATCCPHLDTTRI